MNLAMHRVIISFFENCSNNLVINLAVIVASLLWFQVSPGTFLIPALLLTNTVWICLYLFFSYADQEVFFISGKGKSLIVHLIFFFSFSCVFWLPQMTRKAYIITIIIINIVALIFFLFRKTFGKIIERNLNNADNNFGNRILAGIRSFIDTHAHDGNYFSVLNIANGNQRHDFTYNSKNNFTSVSEVSINREVAEEGILENAEYTFNEINFGDTLAEWAIGFPQRLKSNKEYIRARQLNNRILKRGLDIAVSLFVIVFFLSWMIPVIGLLIKLESKGPVLFKQLRSGINNKPFWCYKFRSMRVNEKSDELQATRNDGRITRIGAFLRKTSLDEFPQFINVLKGEMSIVGPRPHMLLHTELYGTKIKNYMNRLALKQGLTGLAQVRGYRGETSDIKFMEDRVEHDLWYIENWSIWLDIKIIFLTVIKIFKADDTAF